MKRFLLLILMIAFLAACRGAPLSWHVNLLDKIPTKTGSFEIELPFDEAEFDILPFVGNNKSGEYKSPVALPALPVLIPFPTLPAIAIPVDFSNQTLSAKLTAATISYQLKLSRIGDIAGNIKIQAYLTTSYGDISSESSKLGPALNYDLSKAEEVFLQDVVLSENQLTAINEKQLKIAFEVSGSMQVLTAGVVGVAYELQALSIKNLRLAINQKMPDEDGEIADFSDAEPIPSQVVGLKLDYILALIHDGDFAGTVTVQVFLAPIDETDIFQDKYRFGASKDIDLSKSSQDIVGNASINELQLAAARKDRKLRYGMQISGDAGINKGGKISFEYKINKLDLTAYFTIL